MFKSMQLLLHYLLLMFNYLKMALKFPGTDYNMQYLLPNTLFNIKGPLYFIILNSCFLSSDIVYFYYSYTGDVICQSY
jgi:hypothetical protein